MKILIVARKRNRMYGCPIAPFVLEQANALQKCGIEVDYFIIEKSGFSAYWKSVGELKRKIADFKPDLIHAHYGLSGITAVLQHDVPVVTTFHNGETHSWYVNLLTSWYSLRAKHVICVAQHIRDLLYFKNQNYSIIPCGIDVDDYVITPYQEARNLLGWNNQKRYILHGGAFENERKNYALLRETIIQMKRVRPQLTKDGEDFGDIVCVEMKGLSREECVLRMCACDLFVLPTKSEGSPQTIKEAMACGCPIIATDVADISRLLGMMEGHYVLHNPLSRKYQWQADEKSIAELADYICQAMALPRGYRTNGRERIYNLQLSNQQVASRLTDIYKKVIER